MFSSSSNNMFTSAATNLVALARSKLNSVGSGTKDTLSLHRWVLLKNSIIRDDTSSTSTTPLPISDLSSHEPEFDTEEDDDESITGFLFFPDPGNAVADQQTPHRDERVSEAQWLDSLLDKLNEDEEDDSEPEFSVSVQVHEVEDDSSDSASTSPSSSFSDSIIGMAVVDQYPVPYPPIHPPLVDSFALHSNPNYYCSCLPSNCDRLSYLDDSLSSVPDAIEDTSDDESESPSTPFSNSQTSMSFVDPASIPLPRDQSGPIIYNPDELFDFEVDPQQPYPDSDSTAPLYSPYHQNC